MVLLGPDTGQVRLVPTRRAGCRRVRVAARRGHSSRLSSAPRADTALAEAAARAQPRPGSVAARGRGVAGDVWARAWRDGWAALASGWRALLSYVVAEHRATMLPNLLGAAYAACVLVGVPLRAHGTDAFARRWPPGRARAGVVAALLLLGVVHGTLLIYFYSVGDRFALDAAADHDRAGAERGRRARHGAARVRSIALLTRASPRWDDVRARASAVAGVALGVLLVGFAALHARELLAWQQSDARRQPGFRGTPIEGFARWAGRNLPANAVIMARYPWELRFYSLPGSGRWRCRGPTTRGSRWASRTTMA